jgi:hypothetical protein
VICPTQASNSLDQLTGVVDKLWTTLVLINHLGRTAGAHKASKCGCPLREKALHGSACTEDVSMLSMAAMPYPLCSVQLQPSMAHQSDLSSKRKTGLSRLTIHCHVIIVHYVIKWQDLGMHQLVALKVKVRFGSLFLSICSLALCLCTLWFGLEHHWFVLFLPTRSLASCSRLPATCKLRTVLLIYQLFFSIFSEC